VFFTGMVDHGEDVRHDEFVDFLLGETHTETFDELQGGVLEGGFVVCGGFGDGDHVAKGVN